MEAGFYHAAASIFPCRQNGNVSASAAVFCLFFDMAQHVTGSLHRMGAAKRNPSFSWCWIDVF
jgi:hypothetical protein